MAGNIEVGKMYTARYIHSLLKPHEVANYFEFEILVIDTVTFYKITNDNVQKQRYL